MFWICTYDVVDSVLAIHNLGQCVGSCLVAWVIDVDVVSIVAGSQYPMSSVVDIADHDFALIEFSLDLAVCNFSLEN